MEERQLSDCYRLDAFYPRSNKRLQKYMSGLLSFNKIRSRSGPEAISQSTGLLLAFESGDRGGSADAVWKSGSPAKACYGRRAMSLPFRSDLDGRSGTVTTSFKKVQAGHQWKRCPR